MVRMNRMKYEQTDSNGDKLVICDFVTGSSYCWIRCTTSDGTYAPFIVEKRKLREFLG